MNYVFCFVKKKKLAFLIHLFQRRFIYHISLNQHQIKNFFFSFQVNTLQGSVSYVISEKRINIDNILKILSHMVALLL